MELASRQLLRAVRGKRSQVAFARRLGYKGNPVADWESGRRFPTARELLRACQLSQIEVRRAFEVFHEPAAATVTDWGNPELHLWFDALRGGTSTRELSERAARSRFAVGRWLSGQAQPRVPDFLRLVEAATGRASDLVAALVPIEQVPALFGVHQARAAAKALAFEQPWTEAILRWIETPEYHSAKAADHAAWFAERLGIERDVAAAAITAMLQAGVVKRVSGRLQEAAPLTVDTRGQPEAFNRLRAHWTEVAAARLKDPQSNDWFGYNVFAVSETELEQVRQILRDAYRQIRGLAAASNQPECPALINMQLMTWSREPVSPKGSEDG